MYTKILAKGTKFGSGTTGLDHPAVHYTLVQYEEREVERSTCDWTLALAAYWTSSLTTSSWPASAAMWSAVLPFLVAASTCAPRLSSSYTIATWPSFDARCSAVSPFCESTSHHEQLTWPLALSLPFATPFAMPSRASFAHTQPHKLSGAARGYRRSREGMIAAAAGAFCVEREETRGRYDLAIMIHEINLQLLYALSTTAAVLAQLLEREGIRREKERERERKREKERERERERAHERSSASRRDREKCEISLDLSGSRTGHAVIQHAIEAHSLNIKEHKFWCTLTKVR